MGCMLFATDLEADLRAYYVDAYAGLCELSQQMTLAPVTAG
jgi:hypothetical protein